MFCGKCGSEVSESAAFCPRCGARRAPSRSDSPRPTKRSPTRGLVAISVVVVLVVGSAALLAFWFRSGALEDVDEDPPIVDESVVEEEKPPDESLSVLGNGEAQPPEQDTIATTAPTLKRLGPPPALAKAALTVKTSPGLASIEMAGVSRWTTSDEGILHLSGLPPGKTRVVVRKEQYHDAVRQIDLKAGKNTRVEVTLELLPGFLSVHPRNSDSEVQVIGVGKYRESVALELAPGRYQVMITKPFFKSESIQVEVHPGKRFDLTPDLVPLSNSEILADAERAFAASDHAKAKAACRLVLSNSPNDPHANLLLGNALYVTRDFDGAWLYWKRSIDLGEAVSLPIRHHHRIALRVDLCNGVLILTTDALEFRSERSGHDFDVPLSNVSELKAEPQKGGRIHVRIATVKDGKVEKRTYNFHVASADLSANTVQCDGCEAEVNLLYKLLQRGLP